MQYVGLARVAQQQGAAPLSSGAYPLGTEFVHSVRYLDIADDGEVVMAPRMKELRYSRKTRWLTYFQHRELADDELKAARTMLKDDGMVGVVQHRAPEGASYDDYGARQRGYMRKQDVVAIFAAGGFELAGESEINANPNDPANWEGGVWTLPPVLRYGDQDRAKYEAIGESDRMTLLFRKAQ